MRYIVPFYRRSDIYKCEWLKTGEFVKIIVPHPKLADGIREVGMQHRPDLNIESMTIANFVKNETLSWNSDIRIYKKYRLILELSTVWKKYFPFSSYNEFLGAFDSFTQLRGVTTNFDLIEEVLNKSYMGLSEEDTASIEKFWKYLEIRKIYDEHAAYSYLVEKYRNYIRDKNFENMIFYGFSHLSSGQCDMINAMGEFHDIYIPLYINVWREAEESDWIKWLDTEVLEIAPPEKKTKKISLIKIGNNGLNRAIKELSERYGKEKSVEIVLTQKNPDFFHIGELAWDKTSFKLEASIFLNTYVKIFNDIELELNWEENVETEIVLKFLCKIIKKELNKNFHEKDFKIIKIASFIHDEIKLWMDLSEENFCMKIFDYHVFRNSLKLNLPRNYILPKTDKAMAAKIKGLEDIEIVGTNDFVVVCAANSHGELGFNEDYWTDKMLESFLRVGPIKRKALELAILKESIIDIFGENNSLLVIEENLIEESSLWSDILSNFDITEITLDNFEDKEKIDYIKRLKKNRYSLLKSKQWSSVKIQKHLDCPRSFYYSYVDRIHFFPLNQQEVEATDLGSLQHKIISLFLDKFDILENRLHYDLVKDIWDKFLQERGLVLDDLSYKNYFIELKNYSWRGIKTLLIIKNNYPDARFSFEVEFASDIHRGSVDCVISLGSDMIGIVDFKRSGASIPSQKDIFNFKKIQLWYYMYNLKRENFPISFLGYICLAEIEKSQFIFDENVFKKENFMKIFAEGRTNFCSFKEKESQFKKFLSEKIDDILGDEKFSPVPQSHNVCKYCWIDKVCIKEITTTDAST